MIIWTDPTSLTRDEIAGAGETFASMLPEVPMPASPQIASLMLRVYEGVSKAGRALDTLETMRATGAAPAEVRDLMVDALGAVSTSYLAVSCDTVADLARTLMAATMPQLAAAADAERASGIVDGPVATLHAKSLHRIRVSAGTDPAADGYDTVADVINRAVLLYEMESREAAELTSPDVDTPVVAVPLDTIDALLAHAAGTQDSALDLTVDTEFLADFTAWTFSKWVGVCTSLSNTVPAS